MKIKFCFLIVAFICLVLVVPAFALDIGTNITINDNNPVVQNWSQEDEDNEAEPGMVQDQIWDLEGFFLKQNILSMVGGYNFKEGQGDYMSGDIFISTDPLGPVFGDIHDSADSLNRDVANDYRYNYVFDLTFDGDGGSYTLLELDSSSRVSTAYYAENQGSSPWKYNSDDIGIIGSGLFSFQGPYTDEQTGFSSDSTALDTHYLLTGFDLSFLGHGTDFYAHFTMGCGNDNLMGQGTVVPEPSTFLLLGVGGGFVWLARRRKLRK